VQRTALARTTANLLLPFSFLLQWHRRPCLWKSRASLPARATSSVLCRFCNPDIRIRPNFPSKIADS
jgi:hypothetical protein